MRPRVNLEYELVDEISLEIEQRAEACVAKAGEPPTEQRIPLELVLTTVSSMRKKWPNRCAGSRPF
jgi:hypothetical protein